MATNTTYTAASVVKTDGVVRSASGKITFPADAITAADSISIECGFAPKYVEFVNATDRIKVEYYNGMADNTCLKTAAAGTVTLETTNGGVTVSGNSFAVTQNATLAVIAASKVCYWRAVG